ncbi:MAG TPA: hypothetical protein VEV43_04205 [Actinomycetota bacterium]|nr:hypothetical protein [Actinomycetota bacterium]
MDRPLHRTVVAVVAIASLFATACDEAAPEAERPAALDLVPANASSYFEVAVDPPESQRESLAEVARRFPGDVRRAFPRELPKRIEEALHGFGLDVGLAFPVKFEDLGGWLGGSVAGFVVTEVVQDFSVLLFAVDGSEEDAIASFSETLKETSDETYRGVEYVSGKAFNGSVAEVGVVDGYLVVAGEGGFAATVDASEGDDTLRTVPEFEQAVGAVADDALATFYVDVGSLRNEPTLEDQITREELRSAGLYGDGIVAASLSVHGDTLVVDASSGLDKGGLLEPVLRGYAKEDELGDLPHGAWLAARVPKVRAVIGAAMKLTGARQKPGWKVFKRGLKAARLRFGKDVLRWMGDGSFYLGGGSPRSLDAGLLVDSRDPRKTGEFVVALGRLLAGSGLRVSRLPSVATAADFDVRVPPLPGPLHVSGARAFSITYGRTLHQALREDGFLDDADDFVDAKEALGEGYGATLYADVDAARAFSEGTVGVLMGVLPKPFAEGVEPFLDQGDYLIHGVALEDDRILQRIVIGVR